jgi:hypothetical protein
MGMMLLRVYLHYSVCLPVSLVGLQREVETRCVSTRSTLAFSNEQ